MRQDTKAAAITHESATLGGCSEVTRDNIARGRREKQVMSASENANTYAHKHTNIFGARTHTQRETLGKKYACTEWKTENTLC